MRRKPKIPNKASEIQSRSHLEDADAEALINSLGTKVSEHFDSVVVACTRVDRDGLTRFYAVSFGNTMAAKAVLDHAATTFNPFPEPDDEDDEE